MQSAPLPANEALRLAALDSFDLLYTPAEERFDRLTRVAAHALAMPVALVTLVASEQQWFKSRQGYPLAATPRAWSFCAHTILQDEPLLIADSWRDRRFHDNPLARGDCPLRFYAGVPLRLAYGVKVGTLCVSDHRVRSLSDDELAILIDLARVVESELQHDDSSAMRPSEDKLMRYGQRADLLDPLTGCWSRAGFESLLQAEVTSATVNALPFALLMMQVEGVDSLHAAHGALFADLLLAQTAARLRRAVHGYGTVTRFGSDTFVMLISPCDRPMLAQVQRRLRATVQGRPFLVGDAHFNAAVSAGGAIVGEPGFDVALALVDAERRLRQARRRAAQ